MKVLAFLAFAVVLAVAQGKVFTRCSMAQTLLAYGFPREQLADWVCLIQYESSFNTAAVGAMNRDGSQDYGLFHINNKWWCQGAITSSNSCGISCSALLSDDISAASTCAKLVYKQQGFEAWFAWLNNCNGRAPSVNDCL